MPCNTKLGSAGRPALTVHALVLLSLWLGGCATRPVPEAAPAHDGLDAVTWLQTSTEYAAVTTGVFVAAAAMLEHLGPQNGDQDRRRAIVLDVDETVLDNAPYQVRLVRDAATYDGASWDQWIELRAAEAVPGAVDFIATAQSLGLHIAFITNRRCRARSGSSESCPQHTDTLANLEAIGIDTASVTLMLRGDTPPASCLASLSEAEQADGRWSSDKSSRRACVALENEIVMLLGDQLGDFIEVDDGPPVGSMRSRAAEYREYWGTSWFMLPNPTYGAWRPGTSSDKRALLRGID